MRALKTATQREPLMRLTCAITVLRRQLRAREGTDEHHAVSTDERHAVSTGGATHDSA